MKRYKCNDCDMEFEESEAGYYQPEDFRFGFDIDNENRMICPYCESMNIEEILEDE